MEIGTFRVDDDIKDFKGIFEKAAGFQTPRCSERPILRLRGRGAADTGKVCQLPCGDEVRC